MRKVSMIAVALIATTLAGSAYAQKPPKITGAAGPVCLANGTLARRMAEGRDLGRTEAQQRELTERSLAKITVRDMTKEREEQNELITMVYHDPQVKDSDPVNAEIRGTDLCVARHGPGY